MWCQPFRSRFSLNSLKLKVEWGPLNYVYVKKRSQPNGPRRRKMEPLACSPTASIKWRPLYTQPQPLLPPKKESLVNECCAQTVRSNAACVLLPPSLPPQTRGAISCDHVTHFYVELNLFVSIELL